MRGRVCVGQRVRLAGIQHVLLDELGSQGPLDWSRAIVDGACVRAKKGDL
jgi:hypothetical protein